MKAKDDMNLTLWAAMLMLQVAFAVSSGPDAWPLAEDASVVSVLNAVVFGAAVVLCALSLWEILIRRTLTRTRAVLWALAMIGFRGPEAWPFVEGGNVLFTIGGVAGMSATVGIIAHDIRHPGGHRNEHRGYDEEGGDRADGRIQPILK